MVKTKEQLLEAVVRFGRRRRGKISLTAFCKATGVGKKAIRRWGGWTAVLGAAGLGDRQKRRHEIPRDALLAEYHRLTRELRRRPSWGEMAKMGRYSTQVYFKHFGRTEGLLREYEEWLRRAEVPDTPAARLGRIGPGAARADGEFACGTPLSFRGLLHAPTCEAGVIHLFGVLSRELGFAIVSIRGAFPDCLALRPSPVDKDRWDPVRIEFEHRSANFRLHGHDATKCDLIVCWEDDWEGCPLQVMELKKELGQVQRAGAA